MSSINPNRYQTDYTGVLAANQVKNEAVTLTTRKVRVFAPKNAPYYKDSMVIKDMASGVTLTSNQWKAYYLVSAPSAMTDLGKEVYAIVIITDQAVGNNLSITYQTVGGDYVTGYDNLVQLLTACTQDARPITWPNVLNVTDSFTPNQHLHPISDTFGWEYLATYLEQLKLAILFGDDLRKDAVLSYVDNALASSNAYAASMLSSSSTFGQHVLNVSNPHGVTPAQLNLGNVLNYPVATTNELNAGTASNRYVTVDQVATVVRNAVNQGMDAHIARTDNPHTVTPAQVGLGNLLNYGVATLADLNNPVVGDPKYVVNTVAATWVQSYFTTQQTGINTQFTTINTRITDVASQAQSAADAATSAQSAAQNAVTQSQAATTAAQSALDVANQNKQSVVDALSSVNTQFSTYVAQAVSAARDAGYAAGYAAGLAAR